MKLYKSYLLDCSIAIHIIKCTKNGLYICLQIETLGFTQTHKKVKIETLDTRIIIVSYHYCHMSLCTNGRFRELLSRIICYPSVRKNLKSILHIKFES